jgi:hypothetical protein
MAATVDTREVIGEATLGELEDTRRGSCCDRPTPATTRPARSGTPPTTSTRRRSSAAPVAPTSCGRWSSPAPRATSIPDELTTIANLLVAPPLPFLPEAVHGQPVLAVLGLYAGSVEDGATATQPLRTLGQPIAGLMGPMP